MASAVNENWAAEYAGRFCIIDKNLKQYALTTPCIQMYSSNTYTYIHISDFNFIVFRLDGENEFTWIVWIIDVHYAELVRDDPIICKWLTLLRKVLARHFITLGSVRKQLHILSSCSLSWNGTNFWIKSRLQSRNAGIPFHRIQ